MKRKKKRVGLVTKLLLVAFAIYAAFQLVDLQIRINAASAEQEQLQEQLESTKLEYAELEDAVSEEDNADYIAKIARERLNYVYPGEQVFVDISSK